MAEVEETSVPSPLKTHYEIVGLKDGPTVVLCHSLGTSLELWDGQLDALSREFRILRYDVRGHGGSTVIQGDCTMEVLADDLIALLDGLEVERVCFCGVSLGAMIGLQLAVQAPERVNRLVLAGASAHMTNTDLWRDRVKAARRDGLEPLVSGLLARWFTDNFAIRNPDILDRFAAITLGTDAQGYAACTAAILDFDIRDRLEAISAPTLILSGDGDIATPADYAQSITEAIPNARLETITDAGHLANVEQPEEFNRLMAGFLAETI